MKSFTGSVVVEDVVGGLVAAFNRKYPEIKVRVQATQGQDWSNSK
jgi:hypothetical protein